MRKIAVVKTDVIKYAAVCRITGLVSLHPHELTLPSLNREVRATEDASLKFVYLVLRNTRRPNVKSLDYLPNLLGTKTTMETQTATGLGEKVPGTYFSR